MSELLVLTISPHRISLAWIMINLRKEHCLCVSNDYWVFTRLQLDQKAKINKYSFSIVLVSFGYYLEKSCGVLLKRDTKTKLKDTKTYTCTENEVFAVAGTRSLSLWPQCNTDEGEAEVAAMKVIINKQNISIWHSLLQTHLHSWSTDIEMGFCQPARGGFLCFLSESIPLVYKCGPLLIGLEFWICL